MKTTPFLWANAILPLPFVVIHPTLQIRRVLIKLKRYFDDLLQIRKFQILALVLRQLP